MDRIRQRTTGSYGLTATAYGSDGVTPATIVAPVTVTITDGAGTVVLTDTPAIDNGTLTLDVAFDDLPLLDTYLVTWTGVVGGQAQEWRTEFELVGGYLFEIAELRGRARELADTAKYTDERLRTERTAAEDRFEVAAGRAFVPRGRRASFRARPDRILLPNMMIREIYALTIDGRALTEAEIAALDIDYENGVIRDACDSVSWAAGSHRHGRHHRVPVTAHYAFGDDTPLEIVRKAALELAQEYTLPSAIPARATVMTTEVGSYRISVADATGRTGLPNVDAVIAQVGFARPATGAVG